MKDLIERLEEASDAFKVVTVSELANWFGSRQTNARLIASKESSHSIKVEFDGLKMIISVEGGYDYGEEFIAWSFANKSGERVWGDQSSVRKFSSRASSAFAKDAKAMVKHWSRKFV